MPSTMETRRRDSLTTADTAPVEGSAKSANNPEAPSGFILKLFSMVNGAPDEVIAWTPSGDAFVIGSDVSRLESETLPQFFRHNRFQSLVRQLNFYSFRKINRERNVWIYAHSLFHRDRPEDLHHVRRRTCPGMDGRKQRCSRVSADKLTETETPLKQEAEEEEDQRTPPHALSPSTSEEDDEIPRNIVNEDESERWPDEDSLLKPSPDIPAKRERVEEPSPSLPVDEGIKPSLTGPNKRRRRSVPSETASKKPVIVDEEPEEEVFVDTSMLDAVDDVASFSGRSERFEIAEQSMVVSEVARKLDQHARKAMGTGGWRRSGTGVITPPFGSFHTSWSASSLITYDDENLDIDNEKEEGTCNPASSAVLGNGSARAHFVTPNKAKDASTPMEDLASARMIARRLLDLEPVEKGERLALSSVAGFCMITSPASDQDALCVKIGQLLASCDELAAEFQRYRAALHPQTQAESWPICSSARSHAVREFKTFAINLVCRVFDHTGDKLCDLDKTVLRRTVEVWRQSI